MPGVSRPWSGFFGAGINPVSTKASLFSEEYFPRLSVISSSDISGSFSGLISPGFSEGVREFSCGLFPASAVSSGGALHCHFFSESS